jgi:para-nitrobenzyl esterase
MVRVHRYLAVLSLVAGISVAFVGFVPTRVTAAAELDQVKTESGVVSGIPGLKPGVEVFKGIPFAAPPVGELRWRAPQPPASWTGVRKGDKFAAICPQKTDDLDSIYYLDPGPQTLSEDCLYLNVWTPARTGTERLPVMVWIYGGGFDHGSGTEKYYWGDDLAHKGAVVVTFNYRVGVLGFLAHPDLTRESANHASGNYALLDQVAALAWVRKNIAAFGGDPTRVTIFGQSAGAASVGLLTVSPLAKGLFQRAAAESGGIGVAQSGRGLAVAEQAGVKFAGSLGAHSIAELRAKTPDQLRSVPGQWRPIVDGYVLPMEPAAALKEGKQNDVPLIAGWVANEGGARHSTATSASAIAEAHATYGDQAATFLKFFPADTDAHARASFYALAADRTGAGQRNWLNLETQSGKSKTYLYLFSKLPAFPPGASFREGPPAQLGAYHAVDLIYVFDHLYLKNWPWTAADHQVADDMSSFWVNFAATGDPNGKGLPSWPAYDEQQPQAMNFDDSIEAGPLVNKQALDFLIAHPPAPPGARP